jgi:CheY-like chemotaxis protein
MAGGKCADVAVRVVTAGGVPMAVILIVEDDVFIRESAEMVIQDWGHQTLVAGDVNEALVILRSPQHIDALFTDIYLKKAVTGGCELAREAMRLRPHLRVLYTTGNAITDATRALFVEGTHCLRKPYGDHQLRASIDDMLAA